MGSPRWYTSPIVGLPPAWDAVSREDFKLKQFKVYPGRSVIDGPGGPVRIKPKSMAVLCRLAESAGDVVSRNDIFDAVWPGGDVTDDVLTHCIVELRKAFDDSAKTPAFIETVPRMGIRLVPPVEALSAGNASQARRFAWILAGLAVIAAVAWFATANRGPEPPPPLTKHRANPDVTFAEQKSIAVLPFVDMSPAGDKDYFTDGLTEELINRLAQIDELLVTGRTSSFYFKGRNEDLREIGRQLSVQYILEGSVRYLDTDLRITAQLVEVDSGFHLWSRTYDASSDDIFEIQAEISESVAEALSVELGLGKFADEGGTTNYAAYEALLLGDAYFEDFSVEAATRALEQYQKAARIDPEFAIAWVRVGLVHSLWYLVAGRAAGNERQFLVDEAYERAYEIAPNSVRVLLAMAENASAKRQWADAMGYIDRATELAGRDMRLTGSFAEIGMKLGFPSMVLDNWTRLRRLEPMMRPNYMLVAHAHVDAGEFDEAADYLERGWSSVARSVFIANEGIALAMSMGDDDLLRQWLERAMEKPQEVGGDFLASMQETLGQRELAVERLHEWYELGLDYDYYVAFWASYYGDVELALKAMRRSGDLWVFWSPATAEARATDEFKEIITELGVVDAMREYGWNEFCEPVGDTDFECR